MKKIFILSAFIVTLGLGLVWFGYFNNTNTSKICAFCNPEVLKKHTFYEDDLVRGICSYKPVFPGHSLVVVKRHINSFEEVTDEEFLAVKHLLKKINNAMQKIIGPSIYIILQKNGYGIQSVPHVHFHYISKELS